MTIFSTFKEKLFFNKGINSGNKENYCCRGKYNEKWDRILATVTAVLTFILLLTYVIVSVLNESKTTDNIDGGETSTEARNKSEGSSSRELDGLKCEIIQFCEVTCSNFVIGDNIADHINEATKNASCPHLHPLKIIDSKLANGIIKEGWLSPLTHSVSYLFLAKSNITEIGVRAFSGHPFYDLKILEMEDLPLQSIQSTYFTGASFETFSLTYSAEHTLSIEQKAFEGIQSTLSILNFKRCIDDAFVLSNMTGVNGNTFQNLAQIDLSYNSLTYIPNSSFIGAPKLIAVYLHGNKINHIQPNAFQTSSAFSPIKSLYLNNNELNSLDKGVFQYFLNDTKIDVRNNPWNCNCSLQWLKSWYENISILNISDALYCANSNNKKFADVDFGCQENGTTTNTTVPPHLTSPSQDAHYDYIEVQCAKSGVTNFPEDYDYGEDLYFLSICLRTSLMELEIYEIDVESATFEVRVSEKIENSHVMWYNTKNKSDSGCVSNVDDKFVMKDLEREATYTICALKDDITTSPYDCVGFVVPVEWGSRTWLPNKLMKPIIGGLCSVLLLEAVIIGVIVFYCIRQHPKFISGNKRVVVVTTKATDAIIMPRNYSHNAAKETSAKPNQNKQIANTPGYLTPKYARMNDKRKRMLRSMSESSVLSGSYISKEEIYRRRRMETTLYELSDEEHIYECPALPPNHPSEVRKHSCK